MVVNSSVTNATSGKAIFSVAGELFLCRRFVQIIANEIEWTYPNVEKAANCDKKKSPHKELKSKNLDFEEKFIMILLSHSASSHCIFNFKLVNVIR
jgi:hypothetical protein